MAGGTPRVFGIAEHRILMPRNSVVNDLVGFAPAPFELGLRGVDQNPLAIGKIEGFQRTLPDHVENQGRPGENLLGPDVRAAYELAQRPLIHGRVVMASELVQGWDIVK